MAGRRGPPCILGSDGDVLELSIMQGSSTIRVDESRSRPDQDPEEEGSLESDGQPSEGGERLREAASRHVGGERGAEGDEVGWQTQWWSSRQPRQYWSHYEGAWWSWRGTQMWDSDVLAWDSFRGFRNGLRNDPASGRGEHYHRADPNQPDLEEAHKSGCRPNKGKRRQLRSLVHRMVAEGKTPWEMPSTVTKNPKARNVLYNIWNSVEAQVDAGREEAEAEAGRGGGDDQPGSGAIYTEV